RRLLRRCGPLPAFLPRLDRPVEEVQLGAEAILAAAGQVLALVGEHDAAVHPVARPELGFGGSWEPQEQRGEESDEERHAGALHRAYPRERGETLFLLSLPLCTGRRNA